MGIVAMEMWGEEGDPGRTGRSPSVSFQTFEGDIHPTFHISQFSRLHRIRETKEEIFSLLPDKIIISSCQSTFTSLSSPDSTGSGRPRRRPSVFSQIRPSFIVPILNRDQGKRVTTNIDSW